MDQIKRELNALSEYRSQRDRLNFDLEAAQDAAIPDEVRQALQSVRDEFEPKLTTIQERISALEERIRAEVQQVGETVKGDNLQAVWSKGRVSWDEKALSGYAKAHPELLEFRKQGEPSVSIRNTSEK